MPKFISFFVILLLFFSACKKSDSTSTVFDRSAMLQFYSSQIIQPAFQTVEVALADLQSSFSTFSASTTQGNLEQVQAAWIAAYTAWQSASAFNFGPAGESGLRKSLIEEIAIFPVNTILVENYIASNDFSLNNSNRDSRGFLAAEYLLFGAQSGELLSNPSRRAYLQALINDLQEQIGTVVMGWKTYSADFIKNDGTNSGSSISVLYNEFVRNYEFLKNFKIGLPAGKRIGQTQPEPQLVEAYYSSQSLAMLKLQFEALERIYYGKTTTGQEGPGFKEYLDAVNGGPALVASIENQLEAIRVAMATIPADQALSDLMAANHPSIEKFYTELQKHTRYFKSDMSSILGIAITFASSDGD